MSNHPSRIERVNVYIHVTAKSELDKLCQEYPDIKQMYFISNAILDAISIERFKRGIVDSKHKSTEQS